MKDTKFTSLKNNIHVPDIIISDTNAAIAPKRSTAETTLPL